MENTNNKMENTNNPWWEDYDGDIEEERSKNNRTRK